MADAVDSEGWAEGVAGCAEGVDSCSGVGEGTGMSTSKFLNSSSTFASKSGNLAKPMTQQQIYWLIPEFLHSIF